MTDVTGFTPASTPPAVSMTSTLSRTNSAAISAARSRLPPAQRYSIATVRPSIQPSSASRRTKAAVQALHAEDVAPPKIPTVGSFACCADAASGHAAAAPPSSDINARRFTAQYLPCVLTTERIPHLSYGRSLLRCGISSRSMTALGQLRQIDTPPAVAACPLRWSAPLIVDSFRRLFSQVAGRVVPRIARGSDSLSRGG